MAGRISWFMHPYIVHKEKWRKKINENEKKIAFEIEEIYCY